MVPSRSTPPPFMMNQKRDPFDAAPDGDGANETGDDKPEVVWFPLGNRVGVDVCRASGKEATKRDDNQTQMFHDSLLSVDIRTSPSGIGMGNYLL